jgi:hypothetical protein
VAPNGGALIWISEEAHLRVLAAFLVRAEELHTLADLDRAPAHSWRSRMSLFTKDIKTMDDLFVHQLQDTCFLDYLKQTDARKASGAGLQDAWRGSQIRRFAAIDGVVSDIEKQIIAPENEVPQADIRAIEMSFEAIVREHCQS